MELDDLLAESVEQVKLRRPRRPQFNESETNEESLEKLVARLAEMEKLKEWFPTETQYIIIQNDCECGQISHFGSGMFLVETSRISGEIRKFLMNKEMRRTYKGLPRKQQIVPQKVDICHLCCTFPPAEPKNIKNPLTSPKQLSLISWSIQITAELNGGQ